MVTRFVAAFACGLACLGLTVSVAATAKDFDTLPAEVREVTAPLELLVVVPQDGMQMLYVSTLMGNRSGGYDGILAGVIGRALERREVASYRKKAIPFDAFLAGFDIDALAMSATRAAFAETRWLRAADARIATDRSETPELRTGQAVLTYEYAIDPPNSRIFVSCLLQIGGTDVATGWQPSNLRYSSMSEASVEFQGGARSKQERFVLLTANNGARLRQAIDSAFHSCARLAARRAGMSAEEVAELRAHPKFYVTIKSGLPQLVGWVVEGATNTVSGKSPIGIAKTFTAPNTPGVTLLREDGLWHNRVELLPAP